MTEQWKQIPGFERYEASDEGRVRSWVHSQNTPRLLALSIDKSGYRKASIWSADRRRWNVGAHRLIALAFLGPRSPGQEVRHLDGNPLNNRLSNLAYGSRAENELDAVRHGTHQNARKTHCPQGHAYDKDNTQSQRLRSGTNQRECRLCKRARSKAPKSCPECGKTLQTSWITKHRRLMHAARDRVVTGGGKLNESAQLMFEEATA